MKNEKMPNITLSMPKDEQERLKQSAKKHRQSVSQHVLWLLDQYEPKGLASLFDDKKKVK